MRRVVAFVLGVSALAAAPAAAKFCGDDVQGKDVPCACGDIVVSNVTLHDDPVVALACKGDGLVVRQATPGSGITVDLNGKTLRGGKGGTGVWVVDGGSGGARIVSNSGRATIAGFRDGIVGRGDRGVSVVENIDVRGISRDGLRLDGDGYQIRSVEVVDAGRDGFSLDGRDYRCDATRAVRSGRYGYFIDGTSAIIGKAEAGNAAVDGGNDGFHLMGSNLRLNVCTASGNRKDGVSLRGAAHEVTGCTALNNGEDGIGGDGGGLAFYANRAENNSRNGLIITGLRLVDGGGNQGSGNRGDGQQRAATQCQIGSTPCQP